MAISYAQIEGLWIQAGGSQALAPVAAAVAMAESGGNPQSHNSTPPDDSYGLWQINMYGSLGPSRRSQFGLSSNTQLYDPLTNAKAAVAIGRGGFGPWTTFTSGAYKKYLNGAVPPDLNSIGAGAGIGAGLGGSDPVATQAAYQASLESGIMKDVFRLMNTLGNMLVEGGALLAGAVLVGAGFYMLLSNSGSAAAAIGAVGGPVARAATGLGRKNYASHVKG